MYPFLELTNLTDEQLLDKISKAQSYLRMQTGLGHVPTVNSISDLITALEIEYRSRQEKIITEASKKKNPDVLKSLNIGYLDE